MIIITNVDWPRYWPSYLLIIIHEYIGFIAFISTVISAKKQVSIIWIWHW